MDWEFEISRCRVVYRMETSRSYCTGNYNQYLVISQNEKEYIYVCIYIHILYIYILNYHTIALISHASKIIH